MDNETSLNDWFDTGNQSNNDEYESSLWTDMPEFVQEKK